MKTIPILLFLVILTSCEKIPESPIPGEYVGIITYDLPSVKETHYASRTFFDKDSCKWYDAPHLVASVNIVNGSYAINLTDKHYPSCADSLWLEYTGTGTFVGDSLFESGECKWRQWVYGMEFNMVGEWKFKGKRQ